MKSKLQNIILPVIAVGALIIIVVLGGRLKSSPTAEASWSISFDTSASKAFSKTTTATTSITVGTGAYEALVIGIAASGTSATAVTVDGHAATEAIATSTTGQDAEIWYYLNAASGLHTVSSTFGANASGTLIISSYFGVNQNTPLDVTGGKGGSSKTPSSTVTTTVANDWVVDMNAFAGSTSESGKGAGQTTIATSQGNTTEKGNASYKSTTTAGATVTSWTLSASVHWEEAQAAFEVANGSGYTWTDAAGDNNWNTAGNWSGDAVPGSGNVATFSASSTANCSINAAVDVGGISMAAGYSGTITQTSGHAIIVESSGFSEASGTFVGSSAGDTITVNGTFTVGTSTTFTSTNGNLLLNGVSSTFAGTFNNNLGLVEFISTSTSATFIGSSTFYGLNLGYGASYNGLSYLFSIPTGTVLTVVSTTTFNVSYSSVGLLGGGTINAQGNVLLAGYTGPGYSYNGVTSTFNFVLNGTGNQAINDQGYGIPSLDNGAPLLYFFLPSLTINKPSGVVSLRDYLAITGNFINDDGPSGINAGTSTVILYTSGSNDTVTGSTTFYNLWLGGNGSSSGNGIEWNNFPSSSLTFATGTVLTVQDYLMTNVMANDTPGTLPLLGGGEIDVQGNIDPTRLEQAASGTASIVMNGTGTQLIGDLAGCYARNNYCLDATLVPLPNLMIQKPSGIVYSLQSLDVTGSTTISQGEFDVGTSTGSAGTQEFDGPVTIASNGIFSDYAQATSTIKLGTSLTNNGLVFFDGNALSCAQPLPQDIFINSTTTGQQVPWSGSGSTVVRYTQVQDQGGTEPITVVNGTNSGDNGGNWVFSSGQEPQLIQTSTVSGGSGTTQLTFPAFGFKPRAGDLIVVSVAARNQSILAPTDNASNTYTLIASSTFGASPSYALNVYYASNINATSSLVINVSGTAATGGNMLSANAFEYTDVAESSTLDTYSANTDSSGSATNLTSLSATGRSNNELYFGAATFDASTTASANSLFTAEVGVVNNSTLQALYDEDMVTSTNPTTIAATWTSATSTSYGAILGVFHSPFQEGYYPSGYVDSATFDTGVVNGAQLDSVIWQGSLPAGGNWGASFPVGIQIAVSNSAAGPWTYEGPSGDGTTYFNGNAATPIELDSASGGLTLFNGYRYFRYRVTLFANSNYSYTPTVTQVTVNWSP